LFIFGSILVDDGNTFAILMLRKATIHFLFPRGEGGGRASQCAQNSEFPSAFSLGRRADPVKSFNF